jgi:hypothetical protein
MALRSFPERQGTDGVFGRAGLNDHNCPWCRSVSSDGAVQAYGVVVIHVGLNQAQRIFSRQRCAGPEALRF